MTYKCDIFIQRRKQSLFNLIYWWYLLRQSNKDRLRKVNKLVDCEFFLLYLFSFDLRKPHPSESALCGPRWGSKTPAVPGSYKRCMPWLELETCCIDLKPFAITLRPLAIKPFSCYILLEKNRNAANFFF